VKIYNTEAPPLVRALIELSMEGQKAGRIHKSLLNPIFTPISKPKNK
jgi:hypothetical protein